MTGSLTKEIVDPSRSLLSRRFCDLFGHKHTRLWPQIGVNGIHQHRVTGAVRLAGSEGALHNGAFELGDQY